jgi:outer membrane protein OmpA-like peptidoglycan-associated protein
MSKQVVLVLLGLSMTGTGWAAEPSPQRTRHEAVGFGGGAAIGALGGPIGVVVGAAFGTWLGTRFYSERSARADFELRWGEARAEAEALRADLEQNARRAAREQHALESELTLQQARLQQALDAQVYFRTAQAGLEARAEQRLVELGGLIAAQDGWTVRIDGYADARGDEAYNEALSAQRAEAVRDALQRAGVPAERIHLSPQGEADSTAAAGDPDAWALDRRVQIRVQAEPELKRVARE